MVDSATLGTALAAVLVALPVLAIAGEVPPSLLTDDMLNRYRAERSCDGGPAYAQIRAALREEAGSALSARFLRQYDAVRQEQSVAADYDRAARIAGARGCPDVARSFWSYILQYY